MSKRKFTFEIWDFDLCGAAYVIAKDLCPKREDVPEWLVKTDHLDPECINPENGEGSFFGANDITEGFCKFQVRSDWLNDDDGKPHGGYCVEEGIDLPTGKSRRGCFPVWILRLGEWYYDYNNRCACGAENSAR
ncbi:MAG: hypothetical protein LBS21_06860 [Clostridiales bacterium]|jgi:hypothetical protein|nr:hypothetical protein [Clostridiales bacterium]